MKSLVYIAFLIFAQIGQGNAQRYIPKMKGIEFRGGYVDGIQNKTNYYAGLGGSSYTKNANRWVFGVEFICKEYPYQDYYISNSQFSAEGGYYKKFLADPSKTFFLSIGGSVFGGYETINWGKKLLPDGATILNDDTFIYGVAITLEMETYLNDVVVLL
ncbi:MAG: conjugal transfer protein TraO, partial [Fusobacteriaceae bacterium]